MCYLRWNDWFAQNLRKREVKATAFQAEVDQSGFAHQNHTNVITIQRDRLKTFRSESWVIIQHFGHEEVPRSLVHRPRPDGDLEQGRRKAGPRGIPHGRLQSASPGRGTYIPIKQGCIWWPS